MKERQKDLKFLSEEEYWKLQIFFANGILSFLERCFMVWASFLNNEQLACFFVFVYCSCLYKIWCICNYSQQLHLKSEYVI